MPDNRIKWYRTPVESAVMKQLLIRRDAKGLFQCLSVILLSICTGALAWYSFSHWPWWVTLAAVYLHGMFYTFLGDHAAIHELSHGTPFKTKALNEFFIRIFSFCTWVNYVQYRASHMMHHQVTVHTDRDLEVELPWTVSRWEWLGYWTFDFKRMFQKIGFIVLQSFGKLNTEWEQRLFPASDEKLRKKLFGWARIILAGQLLLAGIFIASGQWILLLLFTFAPYIGSILAWVVTVPQHAGLPPDVADFRINCRSVKVNPFVRYLHWQMDYHVEHHMNAGVPFFNLKKLRKVIEYDIPEYDGLLATWRKLLPIMRKQRTDPTYFTVPVLPQGASPAAEQ